MPAFQIWTSTHPHHKVEIEEKSATDAVMKYTKDRPAAGVVFWVADKEKKDVTYKVQFHNHAKEGKHNARDARRIA